MYYIGLHDLNSVNKWQQQFHIREVHLHPLYDDYTVDYDVAVVRLQKKVAFNERVRAACLPTHDVNFDLGTVCTASGWGSSKSTKVPMVN